MNKPGTDPKIKKTLLRNCEQKISAIQKHKTTSLRAASSNSGLNKTAPKTSVKKNHELRSPTLCSSEVFAYYLTNATNNISPPLTVLDQNIDREKISSKITKKLNFHFNDKLYKNLVELNSFAESQKCKKDRKPLKTVSKRDLQPDIEDFFDEEKETDIIPTIPTPNYKFKPIKKVEMGQLHKLISSFERL